MTASEKNALVPGICADPFFADCAAVFEEYAGKAFGVGFCRNETEGGIVLKRDPALPEEGYRLTVAESGVTLLAAEKKGMHNGLADLLNRIEKDGDSLI
ncbi:MAG: hypothetical protein II779_09110, partial [Clostridia bacterium]|nr:hypothetical protein [Clostridia bacterium]